MKQYLPLSWKFRIRGARGSISGWWKNIFLGIIFIHICNKYEDELVPEKLPTKFTFGWIPWRLKPGQKTWANTKSMVVTEGK